jgi:hypothetical protein
MCGRIPQFFSVHDRQLRPPTTKIISFRRPNSTPLHTHRHLNPPLQIRPYIPSHLYEPKTLSYVPFVCLILGAFTKALTTFLRGKPLFYHLFLVTFNDDPQRLFSRLCMAWPPFLSRMALRGEGCANDERDPHLYFLILMGGPGIPQANPRLVFEHNFFIWQVFSKRILPTSSRARKLGLIVYSILSFCSILRACSVDWWRGGSGNAERRIPLFAIPLFVFLQAKVLPFYNGVNGMR